MFIPKRLRRAMRMKRAWCVVTLVVVGGCAPEPTPDADALIYYFKSASIGGKVRRLWPEGQAYADAVLRACAGVRKGMAPLNKLRAPETLWARSDARWRDEDRLRKREEELQALLEDRRDERREQRLELWQVVRRVPPSLGISNGREIAEFADEAWDALALDPEETIEEAARIRLDLVRSVLKEVERLEPASPGAPVTPQAAHAQVSAQYDTVLRKLAMDRDAFLDRAEAALRSIAERIDDVDRRKQRVEYQYLSDRRTHLKRRLDGILKTLLERIKQSEEGLQRARRIADESPPDGASSASVIEFEERLTWLREKRSRLKDRIDAILGKSATDETP